ncbi:MAG: hypothetical protein RL562_1610 [Planctomycetota bacterium]
MAGRAARFTLLTPPGVGGVAVVEVTGPDRHVALAAILEDAGGGPVRLVRVRGADGTVVDRALRVEPPGGESIELHLHGSRGVLAAVEAAVGGFDGSGDGDPASRLLREALHPNQLALALEQRACGGFAALRSRLDAMSGTARAAAIDAARARSRVARALVEAAPCVLVGRQNAGKSTLLNRLAFRERVLTGATPGLTRDQVRETVVLAGYPYRLVDTAGLGAEVDALDAEAQQRTRDALDGGLVVLVVDGSEPLGAVEAELGARADLWVRTKGDLGQAPWEAPSRVPLVAVSCLEASDAASVRTAVGEALREVRGLPIAPSQGVGGPAALTASESRALEQLVAGFRS